MHADHGLALAHDEKTLVALGELHPQGKVFALEGFFAGPHLPVNQHELADERGHDGEHAHVFFEIYLVAEEPVDVEHAQGQPVGHDGHAQKRDAPALQAARLGAVEKQGLF